MFNRTRIQIGLILVAIAIVQSRSYAADPLVGHPGDHMASQCLCSPFQCDCNRLESGAPPPGTLCPRYPYETFRVYYYRRPYNPAHLEQHAADANAGVSIAKLPYTSQWMSAIYDEIEQDAVQGMLSGARSRPEATQQLIVKDKALEFVDWELHRRARLDWESTQEGLSATLRSLINESVLSETGELPRGTR